MGGLLLLVLSLQLVCWQRFSMFSPTWTAKSPLALTTKVTLNGRNPLPTIVLALRMKTCLMLLITVKVNFAIVEACWYGCNHAWTLVLVVLMHGRFSLLGIHQTIFWYEVLAQNILKVFWSNGCLFFIFPKRYSRLSELNSLLKRTEILCFKKIKAQTKNVPSS